MGTNSQGQSGAIPPGVDHQELLHIRETINMLCLAVCQIESSVRESNSSVDNLTTSFTELARHSREMETRVQDISDLSGLETVKAEVTATSREMQEKVNQAVTAFQFYDRISQRLDHVARHLERVSEIIGSPEEFESAETWKEIQEKVRSSYTMESERIMFEHIMRGATVKEALEIYQHHFSLEDENQDDGDDEVELF